MGGEIGKILVGVLAVYGLTDLLVRLSRWLWMPKHLPVAAVVPLRSPDEQLEQTLHRTTEEMLREKGYKAVMFVDVGLSSAARALAERLSETTEYSPVLSPEKMCEKLQFMQK